MQKTFGLPTFKTLPTIVKPIPRRLAYPFIRVHHYLKYPPRCDKFNLGVYVREGLVGVMTFGLPVARLEDQINTLELTRMCLLPSPKNSESRALSLTEKWIRKHRPEVKRLIAYADSDRHQGKIYLAANWQEVLRHKRRGTWDRPSRHRIRDTGGPKIKFERRFLKSPVKELIEGGAPGGTV